MEWSSIISLVVIGIIVVLVTMGFSFLQSLVGPLADAMKSLFGIFKSLTSIIEKQLENCEKHGFFNVGAHCYIGITIIGLGVARVLAWAGGILAARWGTKDTPARRAITQSVELGAKEDELARETLDRSASGEEAARESLGGGQPPQAVVDALTEDTGAKVATRVSKELNAHNPNPEERDRVNGEIEMVERQASEATDAAREGMSPEEQEALDKGIAAAEA